MSWLPRWFLGSYWHWFCVPITRYLPNSLVPSISSYEELTAFRHKSAFCYCNNNFSLSWKSRWQNMFPKSPLCSLPLSQDFSAIPSRICPRSWASAAVVLSKQAIVYFASNRIRRAPIQRDPIFGAISSFCARLFCWMRSALGQGFRLLPEECSASHF